ncbi:hypothetical protein GB931_18625 [Modestobacter sp. I12A-02628]|nr:hypothetical protein [Goekera deserti]NDI50053.1 hypothetical protein [Goekera deserti]
MACPPTSRAPGLGAGPPPGAPGPIGAGTTHGERRAAMSKRGRKRRARKKSGANHGKRPNA